MRVDLLIQIAEKILVASSASGLSLLALRLLRPRVDVSPRMAGWWSEELKGSRFSIKLINKSRRALVEPRVELTLFYRNTAGRFKSKLIERERPAPMFISGRGKKKGEDGAPGVYTLTYEDVFETIGERVRDDVDAAYLRFRFFARDGWSGIGRQFEVKYEVPRESIVFGSFEPGRSLKVVPGEPDARWEAERARAFAAGEGATRGSVPRGRQEDDATGTGAATATDAS